MIRPRPVRLCLARRIRAPLITAAVAIVLALTRGAAWAQDYVKVDDAGRDQIPAVPFVGVAYGFIWVALLVYVLLLARRLGGVRDELRELRKKLDRQGPA